MDRAADRTASVLLSASIARTPLCVRLSASRIYPSASAGEIAVLCQMELKNNREIRQQEHDCGLPAHPVGTPTWSHLPCQISFKIRALYSAASAVERSTRAAQNLNSGILP